MNDFSSRNLLGNYVVCVLQIDIIPAPLQDSCYLDDLSFYHILLKVKTQAQVKL